MYSLADALPSPYFAARPACAPPSPRTAANCRDSRPSNKVAQSNLADALKSLLNALRSRLESGTVDVRKYRDVPGCAPHSGPVLAAKERCTWWMHWRKAGHCSAGATWLEPRHQSLQGGGNRHARLSLLKAAVRLGLREAA